MKFIRASLLTRPKKLSRISRPARRSLSGRKKESAASRIAGLSHSVSTAKSPTAIMAVKT
jgi:hypothetical protein